MSIFAAPLVLTDDALLATGGGRMVFAHPDRLDVVVKVPLPHRRKRGLLGLRHCVSRSRAFGPLWDSHVEIREFTRSVSAIGRVSRIYAQFIGLVQTDRGVGAMFEAVRTPDGALALTLDRHAKHHGHEAEIEQAIDVLWAEIRDTWLIISDYSLPNVVVTGHAATGYGLVIVDGIGDRVLIPLQQWFRRIHMKKCERQKTAMLADYRAISASPALAGESQL